MSVQGTAGTRRLAGDRHRVLKGIAFWGFSAIGCFVFGWLVVAPLLTATHFGEQAFAAPETQSAATQPPAPQSGLSSNATISPKAEEKKPAKTAAPEIELSVEPGAGAQKPESLDSSNRDNSDSPSSVSETPENKSPSLDEETPKPTRRSLRTRRASETGEEEPSGTYTVEKDNQLVPDESARPEDPDKPKAKAHRPSRKSRNAEPGLRTNSKNKNSDVQKGESIDQ